MSDAAPAPAKKAAQPKKPSDHAPVAEMVNTAITNLKEKKGSSLAAIKKYVAANNKVDMDRITPFIRRFLKKAVTDGKLVQTKGTGASGSFKLAKVAAEPKKKKPAAKKPKAAKKPAAKKTPTKKAAAKKPAAKKPAAKKPAAKKDAAKKKTPKKAAKKATKSPKKEKKAKAAAPKKPKAKTVKKSPKKAAKKPAKK
jgi:histone H1/5